MKFNNSFSSVTVVPFFSLINPSKNKKVELFVRMWLTVNHSKSYSANELSILFYDLFFSLTIIFEKNSDFIFSLGHF